MMDADNINKEEPAEAELDEIYEIGKRDGYEEAIQELDVATGGDGEFYGSTIPGRGVDVPAMKQRIIDRFNSVAQQGFRCKARQSTLADPQDCDWPVCGCDPAADKVIAALQERDVPILSKEKEDAAFAAYLGISVLRTMCKKVGLTLAEQRAKELLVEMGDAFPSFAGRSALRDSTHNTTTDKP